MMTGQYETVQCRFCGRKVETCNELLAQHFVDYGCDRCQQQYSLAAYRLLDKAGLLLDNPKRDTKDRAPVVPAAHT